MYSPDGNCLYLVWHFGPKDKTGVRYPKNWETYFCRPVFLLTCPIGKLLIDDTTKQFILIWAEIGSDLTFNFLNLDVWSSMGHFKGRRVMTTMCAVREAAPLMVKAAKFHSLMTYCNEAPLNWVYCAKSNK